MSGRSGSALPLTRLVLLCQLVVSPVGAASAPSDSSDNDSGSLTLAIYSDAQAERGKKTYSAKCASCHLDSLAGSSTAPSLIGARFVQAWEARTVRELFGRLRTTMPADDPGSLEENETVDLIAYLLSSNKYPAGATELEPNRPLMESVRIGRPD